MTIYVFSGSFKSFATGFEAFVTILWYLIWRAPIAALSTVANRCDYLLLKRFKETVAKSWKKEKKNWFLPPPVFGVFFLHKTESKLGMSFKSKYCYKFLSSYFLGYFFNENIAHMKQNNSMISYISLPSHVFGKEIRQ